METWFWICLGVIVYTYLGFAMITRVWIGLRELIYGRRPEIKAGEYMPSVTLIVPAWNEADEIDAKVANCLELDYPEDKLRIVFITDGSTDGTDEAVRKYAPRVEVLHKDKRGGKSAAENRAMRTVDTPVAILCDANTILNPEAVKRIVRHYADERVGGVSGEKRVLAPEGATGQEGLYWRYESILKKWDARLYSIVGAAGELVSFRTSLWTDLEPDTILDDFVASLRICARGYRFAYEPGATASEYPSANVREELKRKVRIAAGGWQSMWRLPQLWRFYRHPRLTFSYVSHRVLRWSLSALLLPVLLILGAALWGQGIEFRILTVAQLVFYAGAAVGWGSERKGIRLPLVGVMYYFCVMNYAVIAGFFRWLKGSQKAQWERSKRATV